MAEAAAITPYLLGVAPEIRNRIYNYIAANVHKLRLGGHHHDLKSPQLRPQDHPLARTCRQIRAEFQQLYSEVAFQSARVLIICITNFALTDTHKYVKALKAHLHKRAISEPKVRSKKVTLQIKVTPTFAHSLEDLKSLKLNGYKQSNTKRRSIILADGWTMKVKMRLHLTPFHNLLCRRKLYDLFMVSTRGDEQNLFSTLMDSLDRAGKTLPRSLRYVARDFNAAVDHVTKVGDCLVPYRVRSRPAFKEKQRKEERTALAKYQAQLRSECKQERIGTKDGG